MQRTMNHSQSALLTTYPQIRLIRSLAKERRVAVYLAGGFLRDYFLGRPGQDLDFAVGRNAVSFARRFARDLPGTFVLLDAEHDCARVVKRQRGHVQTFDFAVFRAPTLRQDLANRDFTVNALALPIHDLPLTAGIDGHYLDYYGGREDIRARRVRMTSSAVFRQDPLRLLRAYSLQAVLGFRIERATQRQIRQDAELLRTVSYERVRDELFKILASPRAAVTLRALDRAGLLARVIPHIRVMYGVKQGTYHHLDVWPHSLETVTQLEALLAEPPADPDAPAYWAANLGGGRTRAALLKLAALLHDIGKPASQGRQDGRMTFHGHERLGRDQVRAVARMLMLSTRERFALEDMVLWHLRPGYLSNFKSPSARAVFRYFRDTKDEGASIALLALADQRSTRGPLTTEQDQRHHERICRQLIARFFEQGRQQPVARLINGHDLIKEFQLTPSALFARVLTAVEEQQAAGKVRTRDEALAAARRMVAREGGNG